MISVRRRAPGPGPLTAGVGVSPDGPEATGGRPPATTAGRAGPATDGEPMVPRDLPSPARPAEIQLFRNGWALVTHSLIPKENDGLGGSWRPGVTVQKIKNFKRHDSES